MRNIKALAQDFFRIPLASGLREATEHLRLGGLHVLPRLLLQKDGLPRRSSLFGTRVALKNKTWKMARCRRLVAKELPNIKNINTKIERMQIDNSYKLM